MRIIMICCVLFGSVSILSATQFRIGLANVFFMSALFENNIENPLFNRLEEPPSRMQEIEFDGMSVEYLARYFRYLNADVLVLCEAPSNPAFIRQFINQYLGGNYDLVHNSNVVRNKKYYYNQQVAALVRKDLFNIRRYEALSDDQITSVNKRYPYPESKTASLKGKSTKIYWSRFPIEFDLELKSDPGHFYKFIVTYPKAKIGKGKFKKLKARLQNVIQQKMIRERIEAIANDFEDYFVLGDMNDMPGLDSYEQELGQDGFGTLMPADDNLLFNPISFRKGEGTYIYKNQPQVIDYILASKGLLKGKGQVKPKVFEHYHFFQTMIRNKRRARPDRMLNRELFLSDHAPLTIDVVH